jgi:predicted permease
MRVLYRFAALARGLFRSADIDKQLAEELRFHVERETEANIARGMSPDAARRAARLTIGSVDDAHETSRDERPGSHLRQFTRDISFGARLLRKSWGFSAATIGIVAVGVGAVTAIFTVAYSLLLKPLPYVEPERLVSLWSVLPRLNLPRGLVNAADYREWRSSNRVFEDIGLARVFTNMNLVGDGGEPERLQAVRVSSNLFRVLGVAPYLGRTFTDEEQQPGNESSVILSYGFWQRRYAGDPSIVGRRISLNGTPHLVVGVMGQAFQYPSREFQIWVPLSINPAELSRVDRSFNFRAVARLRPGLTVAQAQREMNLVAKRLEASTPATNVDVGVLVVSMLDDMLQPVRGALNVLLVAVCCLLLIACLNIANLLGARAASRSGEFAVRLALGASRGRLALQTFAEVVPILAIGGVLGVAAAAWTVRAFVAAAPPNLPRVENVELNASVLVIALVALTITGLIASLLPASQAWRSDFTAVTKEGSRSSAGGRRQGRTRRALVVAQIAFAVPLLTGSGLLLRSFAKLMAVNPGIRADGALSVLLAVPRSKFPSDELVSADETQLLDAVRAVPGVQSVGMVNRLPIGGVTQIGTVQFDNGTSDTQPPSVVDWRSVTPGYFDAIGIPLIQGRLFTMHDQASAPAVMIIDERLARAAWPGENVIGKRIRVPGGQWSEIVGVVGHVRNDGLDIDPRPQVYWNYLQRASDRMALIVRANVPPQTLIPPVIQAIRSVDAEQPVYDVRPMRDVIDRSLSQRRLTMILLVVFGAAALLLASVGVYGVVAFAVTQRLREFGIRVALGAERSAVTRLVVGQGATMALVGTAIGLVAAVAAGGVMSTLVFETSPRDFGTFALAGAVLLGVAALASYVPARRAAGVDPAVTLRSD